MEKVIGQDASNSCHVCHKKSYYVYRRFSQTGSLKVIKHLQSIQHKKYSDQSKFHLISIDFTKFFCLLIMEQWDRVVFLDSLGASGSG